MNYQNLPPEQFKRRFGVYYQTFEKMLKAVKTVTPPAQTPTRRGPKVKLCLEEQILVT